MKIGEKLMAEGLTSNIVKSFLKGDVVFYEGDKEKELYIISSGEAEVVKNILDDEVVLARLGTGDFFGEMALFGNESRSATVRAATDLETIVVGEDFFKSQLEKLPDWFGNMFEVLIERIREMDRKVISQFKFGLGISILQLIQLISEQFGTHTENQVAINREFLIVKINQILGVSKSSIERNFQDFFNAKIVEIEPETDKIVVNNKKQLVKFIDFFLCFSENSSLKETKNKLLSLTDEEIKGFLELYKAIKQEYPDTISMLSI